LLPQQVGQTKEVYFFGQQHPKIHLQRHPQISQSQTIPQHKQSVLVNK